MKLYVACIEYASLFEGYVAGYFLLSLPICLILARICNKLMIKEKLSVFLIISPLFFFIHCKIVSRIYTAPYLLYVIHKSEYSLPGYIHKMICNFQKNQ